MNWNCTKRCVCIYSVHSKLLRIQLTWAINRDDFTEFAFQFSAWWHYDSVRKCLAWIAYYEPSFSSFDFTHITQYKMLFAKMAVSSTLNSHFGKWHLILCKHHFQMVILYSIDFHSALRRMLIETMGWISVNVVININFDIDVIHVFCAAFYHYKLCHLRQKLMSALEWCSN